MTMSPKLKFPSLWESSIAPGPGTCKCLLIQMVLKLLIRMDIVWLQNINLRTASKFILRVPVNKMLFLRWWVREHTIRIFLLLGSKFWLEIRHRLHLCLIRKWDKRCMRTLWVLDLEPISISLFSVCSEWSNNTYHDKQNKNKK